MTMRLEYLHGLRTLNIINTLVSVFGCLDKEGYRIITINSRPYKAHRLVLFYVHGVWPIGDIDHIDHNKDNNSFSNLREVDLIINSKNQKIPKHNTSGVVGVRLTKYGTWRATIGVNNKTVSLGTYPTKQEAIAARRQGELKYGFHSNHGK